MMCLKLRGLLLPNDFRLKRVAVYFLKVLDSAVGVLRTVLELAAWEDKTVVIELESDDCGWFVGEVVEDVGEFDGAAVDVAENGFEGGFDVADAEVVVAVGFDELGVLLGGWLGDWGGEVLGPFLDHVGVDLLEPDDVEVALL